MIISRLMPGKDLKEGINNLIEQNDIESGIIICIIGSLKYATLRMADTKLNRFYGPFEIICAQGTISKNGIHVHMAVSDETGHVKGGHLKEGCIINTTAEICIIKSDIPLQRVFDPKTGYKELKIGN